LTNNTAVHFAVIKGYLKLVQQLCLAGEKINLRNKKWETPLGLALDCHQPIHNEIAKSILEISSDQLANYEIRKCIQELIKRNTIGIDFLNIIKSKLDVRQTFFYIFTLFNHLQKIPDILSAVNQIKAMNITFLNEKEKLNFLNQLAKTRILRLSLQNGRVVEDKQIDRFLNTPTSDNMFGFFFDTSAFTTYRKIKANLAAADNEVIEAEEKCRKNIISLK
jgi:ankyrin repeat protein